LRGKVLSDAQAIGVDLFSLNQQVSGAAQSYSKFIAQFTASPLSKFE
jgi:hypothetical protein